MFDLRKIFNLNKNSPFPKWKNRLNYVWFKEDVPSPSTALLLVLAMIYMNYVILFSHIFRMTLGQTTTKKFPCRKSWLWIQVNLCQKFLFLYQLTHNMTTDCSLNYKFNTWKSKAQTMGRTCCDQILFLTFRTIFIHNMFSPCFAKIRASDKDLPVQLRKQLPQMVNTALKYEPQMWTILLAKMLLRY
jgi:hypothetical protein